METSQMTLHDYAASGKGLKRPGTACWACGISEREEMDESLRNGMSIGVIIRWLIDVRGYSAKEVTRNRITHHRDARHHDRTES